jgi:hypothetical protein
MVKQNNKDPYSWKPDGIPPLDLSTIKWYNRNLIPDVVLEVLCDLRISGALFSLATVSILYLLIVLG